MKKWTIFVLLVLTVGFLSCDDFFFVSDPIVGNWYASGTDADSAINFTYVLNDDYTYVFTADDGGDVFEEQGGSWESNDSMVTFIPSECKYEDSLKSDGTLKDVKCSSGFTVKIPDSDEWELEAGLNGVFVFQKE